MKSKKHDMSIPLKFWATLSAQEKHQIFSTGLISGDAMKRLWKMMNIAGPAPSKLAVMFNAEDIMREFPAKPPKGN